jgi:hypothetical protein
MKATFYQSTEVIHTPVDFNNPLHRTLVEMILTNKTPSKEANKVMKKAGFQSQISGFTNTPILSSDLFLRAEDNSILLVKPPYLSHLRTDPKIEEILEYLKTF